MPGLTRSGFIPVLEEDGEVRDVTSQDVNEYLRQIAGEDFTAKDFRTWGGTVLAAIALSKQEEFQTKKAGKVEHQNGDLRGRGTSWQHTGGVPKVLRSSGNRGSLPEPNAHRRSQRRQNIEASQSSAEPERAVLKFLHARES